MPVLAGDLGGEGIDALMPHAELHAGRLADDGKAGLGQILADGLQKMRRAQAAQFLVIGEGEMERRLQRLGCHLRHQRQAKRDEALHVAGAAAHKTRIRFHQLERITGPGLAFDRHHVGMAGEHDAAIAFGPIVAHRLALGWPSGAGTISTATPCSFR